VKPSGGGAVKSNGRTVWVLFHGGAESSQEAYVGVRSADGGLRSKSLGVDNVTRLGERLGWASVRECPPRFRSFRLAALLALEADPVADAFLPCTKGGRNQGHAASRTDRRALVIHV
jgi:hypothetical protein